MKMKTDEREMELRETYWKCKDCKRIYTHANIDRDIVTCPICAGAELTPVTIFKLVKIKTKEE